MKNKTSFLFTIVCCFYLMFSNNSYGQSTQLTYKIKGKSSYNASIILANAEGKTAIQPAEYINSPNIYFILTPLSESDKDVFKEDDVNEILAKISLVQSEKKVAQSGLPKNILNEKGKIESVIISFLKKDFKDYNDFSFGVEGSVSKKITVGEEFFQSYIPQKNIYELGLSKIAQNEYISAYVDFIQIIETAERKPEIKSFSFYNPVFQSHIPGLINSFIKNESEKFNSLNERFQKGKSLNLLKSTDSLLKAVSINTEKFKSFFSIEGSNSAEIQAQIMSFLQAYNNQHKLNTSAFEQEKMLLFKQGNYQDFKFGLYLSLVSKMLLYKNNFNFTNKINPLNVNLLSNPDIKKDLFGDMESDFKIYFELINKNIAQNGFVFNKEIMKNLQDLIENQKQPYYEILLAFNELNSNSQTFKDNLNIALAKCSDETLLNYIEFWLVSLKLKEEQISTSTLNLLNEGIGYIQNGKHTQANTVFESLMKVANNYAPVWYYTGIIKLALGETFSADRFLNKALEIDPQYIAPHRTILKLYLNDSSYDKLLEQSSIAISNNDIWYFRNMRANAFFNLTKYKETILEITQESFRFNSFEIDQYFLLGDAYMALKEFDKAKQAYEKTLEINPFSTDTKSFDARMKVFYEKIEAAKTKK